MWNIPRKSFLMESIFAKELITWKIAVPKIELTHLPKWVQARHYMEIFDEIPNSTSPNKILRLVRKTGPTILRWY